MKGFANSNYCSFYFDKELNKESIILEIRQVLESNHDFFHGDLKFKNYKNRTYPVARYLAKKGIGEYPFTFWELYFVEELIKNIEEEVLSNFFHDLHDLPLNAPPSLDWLSDEENQEVSDLIHIYVNAIRVRHFLKSEINSIPINIDTVWGENLKGLLILFRNTRDKYIKDDGLEAFLSIFLIKQYETNFTNYLEFFDRVNRSTISYLLNSIQHFFTDDIQKDYIGWVSDNIRINGKLLDRKRASDLLNRSRDQGVRDKKTIDDIVNKITQEVQSEKLPKLNNIQISTNL